MDTNLDSAVPSQPNTPQEPLTIPWSMGSILLVSLISLGTATVFIIWQNLLRIKETKVAKLFIIITWIVLILIAYTAIIFDRWSIYGLNLMLAGFYLPILVYLRYLEPWEQRHPGIKPKFSWSILTWGLLGSISSIVTLLIIDVLIAGILQSKTFNPN